MIATGFETRIKTNQIVQNQLPEFILDESPKLSDFLKQYYISQEYTGGPVDLADNLDQYLKLDNLTPEVITGSTKLTSTLNSSDTIVNVSSTKGFPRSYGLIKIDDEIITYTGITTNSFTGCIRGFSGITNFHKDLNQEELVFESTQSASHSNDSTVTNLSVLFLQEFYKKIKYSLTPGLEDSEFAPNLNVGNFIREARSFYQSKGTEESFRILFNVLFGVTPKVIDLEEYLIKSSDASYIRREVSFAESLSGNPNNLVGQTIKKIGDDSTSAAISEVEAITREGQTYYKLLIFVGYDDVTSFITGNYTITAGSRCTESVSLGSSVISVDSTVGFANSGSIFFRDEESGEDIEVFYTDKSVNQFFGCYTSGSSTVQFEIPIRTKIRTSQIYYGYENGDLTKKVELRITGVISDIVVSNDYEFNFIPGDEIYVKSLGDLIKETDENTRKKILANSFIYNTRSRYQIDSFSGNTLVTKSSIEKVSLKKGDRIEILIGSGDEIANDLSNVEVLEINDKTITIDADTTVLSPTQSYSIRRNLNKASSSIVPIVPFVISDVQNTYSENEEYVYAASNSLPSYEINESLFRYNVTSIPVDGYDSESGKASILEFSTEVSFITGDQVLYQCSGDPIGGLTNNGIYYIQVLSGNRRIRLYSSRSFIGTDDFVLLADYELLLPSGQHIFTLYEQRENLISPQKILRKFKINPDIAYPTKIETIPGPVGLMVNGVEILGYKSLDKIYYGPIEKVNVLNPGEDFDVINPPVLEFSYGNGKIQPAVRGSVERVYVDSQSFEIDTNVSIAITGGNGSGASFKPIFKTVSRQLSFDGRIFDIGGGVDIDFETITFFNNHSLVTGEKVIYDNGGNGSLGISSIYQGSNLGQNLTLINNGVYYVNVLNDNTIRLHNTFINALTGINTVGFTTINTSGIHKFRTEPKKILSEIKVLDGGTGYENRKIIVKQAGISTAFDSIKFDNHGFSSGDLVDYSYETAPVSGLSTSNKYYVLKVNDNSFRLCDAGIGGTSVINYQKRNYVKFSTTGSGYQTFSYPPISMQVEYSSVGVGSTAYRGEIIATPVVKGGIVAVHVYEKGSDYGSTIININKSPDIVVKTGKSAQLKPIIVDGQIYSVLVQSSGVEFYSIPNLEVLGDGNGAELRAIVSSGKITQVIVINPGQGYTQENTSILVKSSGRNSKFNVFVRSLSLNRSYKYGIQNPFYRSPSSEVLLSSNTNLQYYVNGYSQNLINYFNDDGENHSPIIGWAYDGNPIYGPYGYVDPEDIDSGVKILQSGYQLGAVENRPSGFVSGFFVNDYEYKNVGDLDEYNGRYCKTPEFPNGVYAYFATVEQDLDGNYVGKFPYFIGNSYRSEIDFDNLLLDQSYNFNNSNLLRNTHPYKVEDLYAGNDFITESNELVIQKTLVESVFSGTVDGFDISSGGTGYRVGDQLTFSSDDEIDSLVVSVSEIEGKVINRIDTSSLSYSNSIITWKNGSTLKIDIDPYHTLVDGDKITVSTASTELSYLNGLYRVGLSTFSTILTKDLDNYSITGEVTDIFVSNLPKNVSIGSSIKVNSEVMSVVNLYDNIIRVKRTPGAPSHFSSTDVYFLPNSIEISKTTDYFNSTNNKKIYFNPTNSVGIGTTPGITDSKTHIIGGVQYQIPVPTQNIYLPNHKLSTNQQVKINRENGSSDITYSKTTDGSPSFSLFGSSDTVDVFIINKSKDYVGIATTTGNVLTGGVYFLSDGSNNNKYYFETDFYNEKVNILLNKATVSLASTHNLSEGNSVRLNVKSDSSVGIGTSTAVRLKYDSIRGVLLVNPIIFTSSGVNTTANTITLVSHGLETGDKVYYSSGISTSPVELDSGETYFVRKIDKDTISLCKFYESSISTSLSDVIDFTTSGGNTQEISKINPKINVIRNNNIVFDVSDSSLVNSNLKIYYDGQFNKEFNSIDNSNNFIISGIGTVGVSSDAKITINYTDNLPEVLFYNLEKSGYISTSDKEVPYSNQINFVDSDYNKTYKIYGIGSTTFSFTLDRNPEKDTYTKDECETLKYYTTSSRDIGPISKVKIESSGEYKELPTFIGNKSSANGIGAYLVAKSKTIGKVKEYRVINSGFDYASDKTIRPTALLPQVVTVDNSNTIKNITVDYGGDGYLSEPNIIIVDSQTREKIESGDLRASLQGSSIETIRILSNPSGLPSIPVEIKAVNNSNGVSISQVQSSAGIVTCILTTPLAGFSTDPFSTGDLIWVEGISNATNDGTGVNSTDLGYRFFTITNYYSNSNPGKLEYSVAGLTTNPGLAKTAQDGYAIIVPSKNYPVFSVEQEPSIFFVGEKISTNVGFGYQERDLVVTASNENFVRLSGKYELSVGELIRGSESFNIATVDRINTTKGFYIVKSSKRENIGWKNDTGKLSVDTQVLSDNDYYQNLSYSVKSPKQWSEIVTPVNRLVHSTGLKNFSDTELLKTVPFVGVGTTGVDSTLSLVNDFFDQRRVDTINNFDFVRDIDVNDSINPIGSKFIQFSNLKLSDYFESRTNRALEIDDISDEFSSSESGSSESFATTVLDTSIRYNRFLVQTIGSDQSGNKDLQINEIITLHNNENIYSLSKGELVTSAGLLGDFYGDKNELDNEYYLRFDPADTFDTNYSIKFLHSEHNGFSYSFDEVDTNFVGFTALISTTNEVGIGSVANVVELSSSEFKSFYANVAIISEDLSEMNYVEFYVNHDETDTYFTEFYFDSSFTESSSRFMGTFTTYLSGGLLKLDFQNTSGKPTKVISKVTGFGSTETYGLSDTYRFKLAGQLDGFERSALYQSNYVSISGVNTATIYTFDKSLISSTKTTVQVSIGQTTVLHQVLMLNDGINCFTTQYPFLSTKGTSGIGTFGSRIESNVVRLEFYPDNEISGDVELFCFTEAFYEAIDSINIPPSLEYGQISESIKIVGVYGSNLTDIDKVDFELNYKGTPIFMKTIDPSNTSVFDIATGSFYYPNHFFSNGEQIIYTPNTTFLGVAVTAMGIVSTPDYLGVSTTFLPSTLFAVKVNNDIFKVATTKQNANSGIGVTFTDIGSGNAHQFEMYKKNEKSIITINNLAQYPISYTSLNFTLLENIGIANTTLALSGISSVNPTDVLKIDNEYMKITNVGLGTTSVGPITFTGNYSLVEVVRGSLGTAATSHSNGTNSRIYRGSYNISQNSIYFLDAPRGSGYSISNKDNSNLTKDKATFSGRVFLRKNYDTNQVYDNISDQFTGIAATYTLTNQGISTVGLGTSGGNGVVFINSIFQTPSTQNNTNNNFEIVENVGITSIVFTGITDEFQNITISDYDVNENQLPRGGMIISLGSTIGLGYAPLVGAAVSARLSVGFGTIVSIEPSPLVVSGRNADASRLIDANKRLIAEVAVGRMLAAYPGFVVPGGNENCVSDIITVLESITYNLKYGGNHLVYDAGQIYISNQYLDGEEEESIYAFAEARDLAIQAMRNETITTGGYTSEVQYFDNTIEGDASGLPGVYNPGDCADVASAISSFVGIVTAAIEFGTLPETRTQVTVPGSFGSGYRGPVSVAVTDSNHIGTGAQITAIVGAGGTLTFNIIDGGSGYVSPQIIVPPPTYEDMPVEGVSRLGIGNTTDTGIGLLLNLEVGESNSVGVGTTVFGITGFKIKRPGYGFRRGDVFRPVGLVTAQGLSEPLVPFELTVLDVFNDSFAAWQFGELNYIDSIKSYQDGIRTRFPLYYNGQLVSFEKNLQDPDSQLIDFDALLLIFINGVLQKPVKDYQFNGGTSFTLSSAPKSEDNISVFFYVGTNGEDSLSVNILETIKPGDSLQIQSLGSIKTQGSRTVTEISGSDKVQTNLYFGDGINQITYRPTSWTKQKRDLLINNSIVSKARDSIESQVYPTAKIIKDFSTTDSAIFVDDADFFNYEEESPVEFDLIIVNSVSDPVSAAITATVSINGTISGFTINDAGSGYVGVSTVVKVSSPPRIGVGIGTTATATATIVSGEIDSISIVNSGFGYTYTSPPQVILPTPEIPYEVLRGVSSVIGYTGALVGIATTVGIGTDLAIKFSLSRDPFVFPNLSVGYPIIIKGTTVGGGVVSIDSDDSDVIGISTLSVDNIYYIHAFDSVTGIATCNIKSDTNISGIDATGSLEYPVGKFSWGRLSGFSRSSSPVSIAVTNNTFDSDLNNYPSIQRRNYGLRDTGAIKKQVNGI